MDTIILVQSVITSIVLPFVLEYIIRSKWSTKVKFIVSVGFTALATFIIAFYNNDIRLSNIPQTILLTIVLTEANYKLWFKCSLLQTYIAVLKKEK